MSSTVSTRVHFEQPLFAVVNADGTLARGSAGTSSENTGARSASYRVFFPRDVTAVLLHGGASASAGPAGTSAPGFITVVGAAVSSAGVFVTTDDTAGANANLGFHLAVTCEGPAALTLTETGPTVSGTNAENQR